MKPIISVRNLSKKYIIGENIHGRGARTFRDIFDYKTKRLFRRDVNRRKEDTTLWALKDVSFDVEQGEVVGIIGRNGAGKSTLLKILSRITEPTEGDVTLRGRVASLLEVGTGFSGELTGRENIFLNGSILGMKKKEIRQNFDEIVAFAEVEKFIDTPVKRYSSGMYVRLAFAVAAYLEPEILLVDEVLAVGDSLFQQKCLGKIRSVAKQGRTVLFVSHNMAAVANICRIGILLNNGRIVSKGDSRNIVAEYLSVPAALGDIDLTLIDKRSGNGRARFVRVATRNESGQICDTFMIGNDINIDLTILSSGYVREARMSLQIISVEGIPLYHLVAADAGFELTHIDRKCVIRVTLRKQKLYPGEYFVNLWLADNSSEEMDRILNAFKFIVIGGGTLVNRELSRATALVHEIPEWSRIS